MTTSASPSDLLIIGGGAVGLSLGWEMSRRGFSVQLVRDNNSAPPASWAGAGILPPAPGIDVADPYQQLCRISHLAHRKWAAELREKTGIDNGFRQCGGLYLAKSPIEAATLRGNTLWWDDHNIQYQECSAGEVVGLEPDLAPIRDSIHSAWFLPGEHQIRNPDHLNALEKACELSGAKLHDDTMIESLTLDGDHVLGARSASQEFHAKRTCICSGAWSRLALEQVGTNTGIMPIRGQMLLYKLPSQVFKHVINEGNRYMVAREDGHLLAGSIEEEVGYEIATTKAATNDIQQWAESILPILRDQSLKSSWAGLRPGSFDGFPYMGPISRYNNLFVASGHFRSGLHLSPGTAIVMADIIQGKTPAIDLTPFRPSRG